jgi:hypothetical protein
MAGLVLGPLLRYVGETEATIWVETDVACEVEILGSSTRTFEVEGHHYALIRHGELEPDSVHPYEVRLDGEQRWPEPDSDLPAPAVRTLKPGGPATIVFGSCRVALPHEEPYTCSKDEDERGREFDALHVFAGELLRREAETWPDLLLLLGDQVYVDEGSPRVREWIRSRRDTSEPPGEEVADFAEYCALYRESWTDPLIRWLFSTVPVAMILDDHDMHDDWNISRSWVDEMNRHGWWHQRLTAGWMTYWIYQHIGNLSPRELERNQVFREVIEADDGTEALRRYAQSSDSRPLGARWSYCRDLGHTRLIVMDSRGGRVLEADRRSIFDDDEWDWVVSHADGDFDHLLLATSDPVLLGQGMHHLEAWSERVCDGAWGRFAAQLGERLRRAFDFDHWAAFAISFDRLTRLLRELGRGERGGPPASIVMLSGDVHHAYLAEVAFPRADGVRSAVWQAVCSPYRNPLDARERRAIRTLISRSAEAFTRLLARAGGAPDPRIRWRFAEGPYFDNQLASIRLDGRRAAVKLEKTVPGEHRERRLEQVFEHRLA